MKEMDLQQITEEFLASFKILNVEIELSDHICTELDWDGEKYIVHEDSEYCPCEIKVDGFNSISKYATSCNSIEYNTTQNSDHWLS